MAKNKKKTNVEFKKVEGDFEYKMSEGMAKAYLDSRKGEDRKKHPGDYLREVVDSDFGIKGKCSRVIIN